VAGQPSMMRTMSCRDLWTSLPGAWNRPQRKRLRAGVDPGAVEAEQLEPRPGPRPWPRSSSSWRCLEVGERHPAETGVLQPLDVLLDVGMAAHGGIQLHRGFPRIGVEAPVAELETRKQACAEAPGGGAPAGRSAGCGGQLLVVDQRGQLADSRTVPRGAVLSRAGSQTDSSPMASLTAH